MDTSNTYRVRLRRSLNALLSEDELRTICFDMSLDYENMQGETKNSKIRSLIEYSERHRILDKLILAIQSERPDFLWEDSPVNTKNAISEGLPEFLPLSRESRVLFSRNPLFVGRNSEIHDIARYLRIEDLQVASSSVVVCGIGGVGKTQLISEFTLRYGGCFSGGVFWINFDPPSMIKQEIAKCGRVAHLNLHENYNSLELEDQVQLVKNAWQEPIPRLLIFDNCEDERFFSFWKPISGLSRIIVTSRKTQWNPVLKAHVLQLGLLQRRESIELLRHYLADEYSDTHILNSISSELGDLPLALHLAGSFMATYRFSSIGNPSTYLQDLIRFDTVRHPSLEGEGVSVSPTEHNSHITRTFSISFESLNSVDPIDTIARVMLIRAAHFNIGLPIPKQILISTIEAKDNPFSKVFNTEKALDRLIGIGLLEAQDQDNVKVHRLLAKYIRTIAELNDPLAQTTVEYAVFDLFRRAITEKDEQCWELLYKYYSNLIELWIVQRAGTDIPKDELQQCVIDVFGRIWTSIRGGYESMASFPSSSHILSYWRLAAENVALLYLRENRNLLLYDENTTEELQHDADDQIDQNIQIFDFWRVILSLFQNNRERVVIYDLYVRGLRPNDILMHRKHMFEDIADLYRVRRNILHRMAASSELRELLES
jgi:Effector-associated domain 7/NB-ARC domain